MQKYIKTLILLLLGMAYSSSIFSKTIHLYANPSSKSQIVANAESKQRLIPIFYPKQGKWLKVANPDNGDVGWVSFEDMHGTSSISGHQGVAMTQRIITHQTNDKNGPKIYRVIEYSGPNQLKEADIKKLTAEMQKRQKRMNQMMKKTIEQMQRDFSAFEHWDPIHFDDDLFTFPRYQPSLIVPESKEKVSKHKTQ